MLTAEEFARAQSGEAQAVARQQHFEALAQELTRAYLTVLCASLGLGMGAAGAVLTQAHLGLGQLGALLVIAFSAYALISGHGERAVQADALADRWQQLAYTFALIQWNADLPGARERLRLSELAAEMLEDASLRPYYKSCSPWLHESLRLSWQLLRSMVYTLKYRS